MVGWGLVGGGEWALSGSTQTVGVGILGTWSVVCMGLLTVAGVAGQQG